MNNLERLIREKFTGRSIVLLGFGREGQATWSVLRRIFPELLITIADANEAVAANPIVRQDPNVRFITGADFMNHLDGYDYIVRSPGIPVWKLVIPDQTVTDKFSFSRQFAPEGASTIASGPKAESSKTLCEGNSAPFPPALISRARLTSQTDLFLQAYAPQVIGVTGTKGKSTTSSLICHLLKTAGHDCILAGNIGNPVFHFVDQIKPETLIVFEMSSHQLEFIRRAPHIAVFLNLFQEHLDAYDSFESYGRAKLNITRYQNPDDFLIFNSDDPLVSAMVQTFSEHRIVYPFTMNSGAERGTFVADGSIQFCDGNKTEPVWNVHQDRFLRGSHNLRNIMAAINVAKILGIDHLSIEDGIGTFKGLEHRLEYVGEFRNIHFYNDSIATIPEACIEAIRAIPAVDTLIAGGFDRGIDYRELAGFLCRSELKAIILVGAAGKRIGREIESLGPVGKNLYYINRFDDFQPIAFRETRPGHACLLSPAAASYDEFMNFEERGKRFRKLVTE